MKKKISTYLFLLLPFLSCSSVQEKTAVSVPQLTDVEVKNGNSLLWKVAGEGIKTSYLYGTIHMINEEFYHFSENLQERIAKSQTIIMELGGMPNPVVAYQLMTLDTGSVHSYFTPDQLKELLQFMDEKMGIKPKEFDQMYGTMKPFLLLQALTQDYFEPNAKSYDLAIMAIAGEKNIPLIGLETIEEQLGLFDAIPPTKIAEMIIESCRNHDEEKKETLKLMQLYSEQKVDKLIPLLQKQSPEFMEFEDLFLYNRNRAWIPKLVKEMSDKSCFVAVGAGHLFGENGVLDLLKKKGLTVTPISAE